MVLSNQCVRKCKFFFFKIYLFLLERWIYREEERQRGRSSVQWFTPQVAATAGAEPIQSQELLPGLPRRYSVPRLWAILGCFPRPQTGSWMGSGAARIRTRTHMGSQQVQGEGFNHHYYYHTRPCRNQFFVRFIYLYWKGRYTERRRDREEDLLSNDSLPSLNCKLLNRELMCESSW